MEKGGQHEKEARKREVAARGRSRERTDKKAEDTAADEEEEDNDAEEEEEAGAEIIFSCIACSITAAHALFPAPPGPQIATERVPAFVVDPAALLTIAASFAMLWTLSWPTNSFREEG